MRRSFLIKIDDDDGYDGDNSQLHNRFDSFLLFCLLNIVH